MRLLVRADASSGVGFGHLVRALAVAEQALARGHEVAVAGVVPPGWVHDALDGLALPLVAPPGWAGLAALAVDGGYDAVHLDDYTAPAGLHARLRAVGVRLVNVEDGSWGRRPADVVVDQTWGTELAPRPPDGSTTLLRGGRQVVVRSQVRRARLDRARHDRAGRSGGGRASEVPLELLVVMGGSDAGGLLEAATRATVRAAHEAGRAAVVRAVGARPDAVAALRALSEADVEVLADGPRPDLPALMAAADLVVSAAGTTAGELCCTGTPMALVAVVDNQEQVLRSVAGLGAAVPLGGADDVADTAATAARLAPLLLDDDARRELGRRGAWAVDGAGAARVLAVLEDLVGDVPVTVPLVAREAAAVDAGVLLEWRNDEEVRRWSRQRGVVAEADHVSWLDAALASPDRHLLVVDDAAATPAATVRWDRDDDDPDAWEVSITLAPHQRGRRRSGEVLARAEAWLRDREPSARSVLAGVHDDNVASRALFDRAGYRPERGTDADGFSRYRKELRARPT